MADRTGIEWVVKLAEALGAIPATWNPVDGCSRASAGCHRCWAAGLVHTRLSRSNPTRYGRLTDLDPHDVPRFTGAVGVAWHVIDTPLAQRSPRVYFAPSMADLFHERLSAEDIAVVIGTMVAAIHLNRHLFITLTKRAARMADLTNDDSWWEQVNAVASHEVMERTDPHSRRSDDARATLGEYGPDHPPPGLWLGVSVEDQPTADERMPHLMRAVTACRVVSAEPLLDGIDLSPWLWGPDKPCAACPRDEDCECGWRSRSELDLPAIGWVFAGEESGRHARRTEGGDDAYRQLRDQLASAGVPFLLKQRLDGRRRTVSLPPLDGKVWDMTPLMRRTA